MYYAITCFLKLPIYRNEYSALCHAAQVFTEDSCAAQHITEGMGERTGGKELEVSQEMEMIFSGSLHLA